MEINKNYAMLKELIYHDIISQSDLINTLYEVRKEERDMKIPKATYREDRRKWIMTIPAKLSKTGKRYPVYGDTEQEVEEEFKKAVAVPDKVPTLQEFMGNVLLTYYYQNISDTTYDKYEGSYLKHIVDSDIGQKPINEVTSDDLTLFFKRYTDGKYQKQTPQVLKILIKETFLRAKEKKWITDNVSDYMVISLKHCKPSKQYKETFTLDELALIETVIVDSWDKGYSSKRRRKTHLYHYAPMFLVMAYTGLRIGEIIGLNKSSLDRKNHTLQIDEQCVEKNKRDASGKKIGKCFAYTDPKTPAGVRYVAIPDRAIYWLDVLEERQKELGICSDYYVINKNGRPPRKSNAYDMWKKILEDAEIEYRPPHKLRKSFVTYAINSLNDPNIADTLSLPDISAMVGHKSSVVTLNIYFKSIAKDNADTEKKAKIINDIFDRNLTTHDNSFKVSKNMQKMREAL